MIYIFYADVTPLLNDTFFDLVYKGLSEERKKRADRLKFRKDKNLSVGGQLLLKYALESVGYDFSSLIFKKEKNGKPYVENENVFFSVSHSGNIALCGVSDCPLGVDIEEVTDYNPDIAGRFFRKNEQRAIAGIKDPEERRDMFFRIWTLKEAYSKMTGDGLGGFREFEIVPKNGYLLHSAVPGCNFYEFEEAGYKISVACQDSSGAPDIRKVDIITEAKKIP